MAIVQAGRQFTADQIQQTAGELASLVRDSINRSLQFKVQLETWTDPDLLAMGLSQEEVNAIKGFFIGDLPAMADLLKASTWIKQLLGTGV